MNAATDTGTPPTGPSPQARRLIETLIEFPTVSRDSNLGLIEWARDYLARLGAVTRLTYDPEGRKANLFATLGEARKPGLILSGHTDVVPVDGQDWHTDPFRAVERDGRLYARGSADMKGFIGVALAQAPLVARALAEGTREAPVHYALSFDEEVGCLGVRHLIRDLAEQGITAAGCLVGEPTSMQPIVAHKGTHRFRCHVRGREAHSSYVTHGVNAIEYAARLIVFIRGIADRLAASEPRDAGFTVPYSTLSTGLVRGGIAANVVPKDCEFQFDLRTLPGTAAEQIYEEIRAQAAALAAEMRRIDPEAGVDVEWLSSTVGLNAAPGDPIVRWAQRLSGHATAGKVSYGTEAGLFQQMGVPSVICGPGDIAQAHRPDEYVSLAQLAECEAFLARALAAAVPA